MRQERENPVTRNPSLVFSVLRWSCFSVNILLRWAIRAALFSLVRSFFHRVFWFALLNYLQGGLVSFHTEEPETGWGKASLPSLDCVRSTQLSAFMLRALRHPHAEDCRLQPWDQPGSGMQKRERTCPLVWATSCSGPSHTLVPRSSSDLRRAPWHQAHSYGISLVPSLSVKGTENSMKGIG